ncbi:AsmA family protein [Mangrovibacterium lignilyticum]|uniref:AsmA family protein n=1 Tax=Mangrovibacterium lignilyticum TaxID=2668052 RepID=UPI0013D83853|nr:AsmA-like C-terminal region-containing protein [Mangrovibacterium lignilyticum]
MKKVLLIIAIIFVVLIGSAILIPVLFKGTLMEKVKTAINENVNATVEFTDFNLSLFKAFPKVQAEIVGLSITGKDQFQTDTLVSIQSIATNLSLSDLFNSDDLKISFIKVDQANINLLSTKDGLVNWDIALPGEEESPVDTTQSNMALSLQSIEVRNLNLTYTDEASTTVVKLKNANLDASGEVDGTITRFNLGTEIGEFVLEYDSVQYISNTVLKAESELMADYDKMVFEFGESHLYLNDLPLDLSGRFEMPSDSMYFDLQLKQPQSDFKTLLAMVPQSYQSYLDGVKTNGEAGFEAQVKGWFYEENYPEINTHIYIRNADLQYQDLPEKISNIALETAITKPQGDLDLLKVEVSKAHAQVRENPVDMTLLLTTPMSDLTFDASLKGKIDFNSLAGAIPMDSIDLKGILAGSLSLKGTMSAVEAEDYTKINSNGNFTFNNIRVQTPQITKPFELTSGTVKINNQEITVNSFAAKTGESDFTLNGKLSNYLQYFLNDQTLQGNFNLQSQYLNLDELASLMAEDTTATTTSNDSIIAFQVPGNLDLTFRSNINRASFDRMDIRNIDGLIVVKNKMLQLQKLNMNMLEGELTIDGNYISSASNQPDFDFNVQINSFRIPAAYQSFSTMQRYMPIASKSTGNISSQIKFKGKMDETLSIIPTSLNGNGFLNTQNLEIVDSPTFDQVKNFIKSEKLKNVKIDDFTSKFRLENGNLLVDPFQTKIADQEVTVSGQVLVDQTVDMDLAFKVNKEDLNSDISNAISFLPGSSNISKLDIGVDVTGELSSPKVSLDLSKAKDQIAEEVKKSTKEELDKSVKKIGNELKKLFK